MDLHHFLDISDSFPACIASTAAAAGGGHVGFGHGEACRPVVLVAGVREMQGHAY